MAFDALGAAVHAAKFVQRNRVKSLALLLAFTALVSLAAGIVDKFVFMMLIAAELVLAFFLGEWQLRKVGIELVTFVTVLVGFAYGPSIGLAIGGALVALHFVLARNLGPHLVYCVPAMAAVGFAAGYHAALPFGSMAVLGVALSAMYNLLTGAIGTLMFNDLPDELVWGATNFALNYFMFTAMAPAIIAAVS
ncbi:MAG: hypothetical protein NT016_03435 [Candidatus Aenigmarchaeota archaeon]|nr:hypothetical protein [Candidatus Aenigmarchaeota archaeon]